VRPRVNKPKEKHQLKGFMVCSGGVNDGRPGSNDGPIDKRRSFAGAGAGAGSGSALTPMGDELETRTGRSD
jgi:hypothetical protein